MFESQETLVIVKEQLPERIRDMFETGYRLVQIGCTRLERFQIDYTFDKAYRFLNLRVMVPEGEPLPSVTSTYACAFTYENEIHDLFGIEFQGMGIDYGGNFYRTGVKAPFSRPGSIETPSGEA